MCKQSQAEAPAGTTRIATESEKEKPPNPVTGQQEEQEPPKCHLDLRSKMDLRHMGLVNPHPHENKEWKRKKTELTNNKPRNLKNS
jgi:hypothetical protein